MNHRFPGKFIVACLAAPLLFGAQGGGCGSKSSNDGSGTGGSAAGTGADHGTGGNGASATGGNSGSATGGSSAATGGKSAATGGHGDATGGSHATGGSNHGGDAGHAGSSNAGTHADAGKSGDQGGGCVSKEGEHCGGNIANPCTCGDGLACTKPAGGPPIGDVGGTCQKSASAGGGSCTAASDCKLVADYCTGCDCRSLAPGQELPKCSGPGVKCFADPCLNKKASCDQNQCGAAAQ